jgi:MFS family permease
LRPAKIANSFLLHTATAIAFVSANPESVETRRGILLLAKFILGMSMGIMMSSCQTYVSEISPPRLRTVLLGFYPFFIVSRAVSLALEDADHD